jgi:hypothetical protein
LDLVARVIVDGGREPLARDGVSADRTTRAKMTFVCGPSKLPRSGS